MNVMMPVLSLLICLFFIKNSDAMADDSPSQIVNIQKLLERWANREEQLLPHIRQARQNKSHTAPYVNEDGIHVATFFFNGKDIVTTHFDDGTECKVFALDLYNLFFPSEKFLRDGKIYDRDGNMIDDVSIESDNETQDDEKLSRISKIKRYVTTKLTRRFTT